MKKILLVFGTRPEAIKMSPLCKELGKPEHGFDLRVCVTAQHRKMLDQVLDFFDIEPDYDLDLMRSGQNLYTLTSLIIESLERVLQDFCPDLVLVHGDTTSAMASSIASFYFGAKVGHIESGLRTYNKHSPFPEEVNRQIISRVSDYHFAPTQNAKDNLINENIDKEQILVTGNTVIDALYQSVKKTKLLNNSIVKYLESNLANNDDVILVTGHRRENHGKGFERICLALKEIAEKEPKVKIIYPVHLNPKVKDYVYNKLSNIENILLMEPLSYPNFIWLMNRAKIIITDSGGVQEEAPSLGKPVLVMRDTTERPEALEAGTVVLVGTNQKKIVTETIDLLNNDSRYKEMASLHNPYGDGKACSRIAQFINKNNG
ncbi:UDP-N-acetylglucosamine 2-epimerase (non-hydrolyzing) [Verrucomicrobiales bacterium]|nr:UDP-N-acetylglucosamine 2-epimerase (non-hydrolyzing) [Verrucomicrobiales bacterium]